jgi:hypothetical protein
MSVAAQQQQNGSVSCTGCGKRYTWKPELAGKKAKCKCGAVLRMPGAPPTAGTTSASTPAVPPARPIAAPKVRAPAAVAATPAAADAPDDLYDVADGNDATPAPKPRTAVDTNFVLARLGTMPPPAPTKEQQLAEQRDREAAIEEIVAENDFRDIYAPIVLIVVGLIGAFIEARYFAKPPATSYAAAIPMVATRVVLASGLMLLGMFLATALMEVTFVGSFKRSILRFIGIALGPCAIYGICTNGIGGDIAGSSAGVFASIIVYWLLFKLLMKLDLQDATVCTVVTWILVAFANYAAFRAEGIIRGTSI